MFMTMSISAAPSSSMAIIASMAFISVCDAPCGNPTTQATFVGAPSFFSSATASATSVGRTHRQPIFSCAQSAAAARMSASVFSGFKTAKSSIFASFDVVIFMLRVRGIPLT